MPSIVLGNDKETLTALARAGGWRRSFRSAHRTRRDGLDHGQSVPLPPPAGGAPSGSAPSGIEDAATQRALAHPEVRRFQEVFDGKIYKVRNLKE